jgi:CBS domain-containing protein
VEEEAKMDVASAMHRNADWVSGDTPVSEIARMMKIDDIGAVPVTGEGGLIGMITDRDIVVRVVAAGRDAERTTAEQIMTTGVVYCLTHQSVEDAIYLMEQKKIRRLPVLDETGRLVGMLSIGDVSHAVPRELAGEAIRAVADHHT